MSIGARDFNLRSMFNVACLNFFLALNFQSNNLRLIAVNPEPHLFKIKNYFNHIFQNSGKS